MITPYKRRRSYYRTALLRLLSQAEKVDVLEDRAALLILRNALEMHTPQEIEDWVAKLSILTKGE